MKKILCAIMVAMMMGGSEGIMADTTKDAVKNVKQQNELTRKLASQKASKDAKKQAKELKKEGWKVSAGSPPLEKQIDRSILMTCEIDATGNPAWLVGEAQSIGENLDGARFQALELAKLHIIQQMEQEITIGVDNALANQQLSGNEAATVTKSTGNTRSRLQQKLSSVRPTVLIYRKLNNGNSEVLVRVFCSSAEMRSQAKQALRDELLKESKELANKVDCIINGYCTTPE